MKNKFAFITMIFALLLTACAQGAPQAQKNQKNAGARSDADFPTKPITLIVPYAAGGGTDQIARILEKVLKKYMPNGQNIVVENKTGGAGTVGTAEVFQAKPDGYKLALVAGGPLSVQPHYGNIPFSHDSFQPVIRIASSPLLLAVKADAPWKTFDEWFDYVKKNPGKFTYSSAGAGNPGHIAVEAFNNATGAQTKNVPFDSSSQAFTALLGGHVQGASAASQEIKGQLDSGNIRLIANLGSSKGDFYKDVPTLKDKGINAASDIYFGIIAPKGLPKDILAILHDAFKKAMEDPEAIQLFNAAGIELNYAGSDEFQKIITESYNLNGQILKKIGLVK
ncbi:Bug family tripartite tricarboxylate transporter substrate binding protein [Paenibacillus hamazuiensis]|uniref:Bug family tripartite tricarboxylate transporter substrate binding protein n=1 Tax=Paenibacillus hamazuiensis TaxID=2936508 RepID=UPI00200BD8D6|nr:tripartite tricarboxylate transporter substrate binding protein [Paenibacillus hamazuiensis]